MMDQVYHFLDPTAPAWHLLAIAAVAFVGFLIYKRIEIKYWKR